MWCTFIHINRPFIVFQIEYEQHTRHIVHSHFENRLMIYFQTGSAERAGDVG